MQGTSHDTGHRVLSTLSSLSVNPSVSSIPTGPHSNPTQSAHVKFILSRKVMSLTPHCGRLIVVVGVVLVEVAVVDSK